MKKLLTCLIIASVMMIGRANAQYLYNMPITVTNNVNSTVLRWQIAIYVNTATPVAANQMKADGRDIRFSKDCIGTQLLDYFIDSGMNTSKTKIWVKMDTLYPSASRTIYMLYGNNSATAASTFNTFNGPYSATNKVVPPNTNTVSDCQRGMKFQSTRDIIISRFGKFTPDGTTRWVTLFDFTSQAIIRQMQVSGPTATYSYGSLTSHLWIPKAKDYILTLHNGTGDQYYYGATATTTPYITYGDMRYCNSCNQNTFPTTVLTNNMYGIPDFEYYTVDTNNIATPPTFTFSGGGGGGNAKVEFGAMPQICPGTTTADVPFTSTFGSPTKYDIVWDATALSAGFTNVTNATFPSTSPLTVIVPATATMGIYRGKVTPVNQCGPGTEANIEIYVGQPVVIDPHDQPKDTLVCPRDPAAFSIKAIGAALSFQWQVQTTTGGPWTNLTNGGNYADVNTTDLKIVAQNAYDGYKYRCMVSSGCASPLSSAEGLLSVNVDPIITTDPGDVSIEQGQTVYFEIKAQGNAKYQWQAAAKDGNFVNINDGGIYQGVKTNKLQVTGVSVAQDQYRFRCLLFNASTCFTPGDTSYAALLTVTPPESVGKLDKNASIKISPNPVNGNVLSITAANTLSGNMTYKIYDNLGRLVMDGKLVNNGVTKADVTALTAGVYFIEIADEENRLERMKFTRL